MAGPAATSRVCYESMIHYHDSRPHRPPAVAADLHEPDMSDKYDSLITTLRMRCRGSVVVRALDRCKLNSLMLSSHHGRCLALFGWRHGPLDRKTSDLAYISCSNTCIKLCWCSLSIAIQAVQISKWSLVDAIRRHQQTPVSKE